METVDIKCLISDKLFMFFVVCFLNNVGLLLTNVNVIQNKYFGDFKEISQQKN